MDIELNSRIDDIYARFKAVAPRSKRKITKDEKCYFLRKGSTIKHKKIRTKRKLVEDAEEIVHRKNKAQRSGVA